MPNTSRSASDKVRQLKAARLRLNPELAGHSNLELEGIEVDVARGPSARFQWANLLFLVLAFLGGAATILTFSPAAHASIQIEWKVLFVASATLCLGFGASMIFYGRLRERRTTELRTEFARLRARADALVARFEDYERSKASS